MTPYYEDGGVRIFNTDAADVLEIVAPHSVDLVITDPPYAASAGKSEWRVTASVAIGLSNAAKTVRKGGAMLVFSTSSGRGIEFTVGAVGKALPLNRVLTWHKSFVRSRVAGPWRWDTVLILCFGRASFGRPQFSSVFTSQGPASKKLLGVTGHPAELPDGIADWLFEPFRLTAQSVLDPFCGTSQLLVPAARLGRQCVGLDLNADWCAASGVRLARELAPVANGPGQDGQMAFDEVAG